MMISGITDGNGDVALTVTGGNHNVVAQLGSLSGSTSINVTMDGQTFTVTLGGGGMPPSDMMLYAGIVALGLVAAGGVYYSQRHKKKNAKKSSKND